MVVLRVSGAGAAAAFADEAGGHRWQESRSTHGSDKIQTSTVTVAVLPEPVEAELVLREADLDWTACRGGGNGGQAVQKTSSAVQLTHLPSGLMVRCESERSQWQNRQTAMRILRAKLSRQRQDAVDGARASDRRAQVGQGQRADKRRTIRTQDGQVHDHVTGRRWEIKRYLKGEW
jgi:peptide chain release factor 1